MSKFLPKYIIERVVVVVVVAVIEDVDGLNVEVATEGADVLRKEGSGHLKRWQG